MGIGIWVADKSIYKNKTVEMGKVVGWNFHMYQIICSNYYKKMVPSNSYQENGKSLGPTPTYDNNRSVNNCAHFQTAAINERAETFYTSPGVKNMALLIERLADLRTHHQTKIKQNVLRCIALWCRRVYKEKLRYYFYLISNVRLLQASHVGS